MRKVGPLTFAPIVLALGCASPVSEAPDAPSLTVGGYVTVDMNPAYGIVTLQAPDGLPLSAAYIDNGRYGVSWPLEAGIMVCDEYRVLVAITEDQGSRSETVVLDASTGSCTMPATAPLKHRVDLDFPSEATAGAR